MYRFRKDQWLRQLLASLIQAYPATFLNNKKTFSPLTRNNGIWRLLRKPQSECRRRKLRNNKGRRILKRHCLKGSLVTLTMTTHTATSPTSPPNRFLMKAPTTKFPSCPERSKSTCRKSSKIRMVFSNTLMILKNTRERERECKTEKVLSGAEWGKITIKKNLSKGLSNSKR